MKNPYRTRTIYNAGKNGKKFPFFFVVMVPVLWYNKRELRIYFTAFSQNDERFITRRA